MSDERKPEHGGEEPRRRVLVVDDEEGILRTFRRILEPLYDVTTLSSPLLALETMARGPAYDAVVCDVRMPDMTGPMLHAAILARRPEVAARFVFVTATVPDDGNSLCGMPVLGKPLQRGELLETVARIILRETNATRATTTE
jgi:CheY-like chemotaxis protein